jgi:hypothetical protein
MFKLINDAGIRVGVTLRPQVITKTKPGRPDKNPCGDGPPCYPYVQKTLYLPDKKTLDEPAIIINLHAKANYAKRWNASVFYVDSTGQAMVHVWDALRELLPGIVFIPEQSDYSLDYATTTPLQDDWGGSPIGVNPMIKAVWPQAYNYQLMQMEVNETKTPLSDWVPLAKQGDVFRVDSQYDSELNAFVEKVMAAAGIE